MVQYTIYTFIFYCLLYLYYLQFFSKCTRSLPTILVDQSLPCVKSTQDTPIYRSIHLVEPQFWSYSDHSTSFSILRQFNISKGCYFCPSRTGGTSSHVRESFIDLNEKIQIGLHGDISFTDSFDEITDSESEEYTLEVPTQFLKESIEKIHSLIVSFIPYLSQIFGENSYFLNYT